jgi:hypothetical protein
MASSNWANTPGPTPGPDGAVKQHQAMASGYVLPSTPCKVDTRQTYGKTGAIKVPGLSAGKKRR